METTPQEAPKRGPGGLPLPPDKIRKPIAVFLTAEERAALEAVKGRGSLSGLIAELALAKLREAA